MGSMRQEHAEVLGYPDHAIYIQKVRMAKNPETVKEFLAGLASKVKQLWEEEHRVMFQMMKEESEELGIEYNGKLDFWDFRSLSSTVAVDRGVCSRAQNIYTQLFRTIKSHQNFNWTNNPEELVVPIIIVFIIV